MNETMVMNTHYNFVMVAISVLISILSAYAALDLAERVTTTRGWIRMGWLGAGALAMGQGIWSMHYIGMLALGMNVEVQYHVPTVILSLTAAVIASLIALSVVSRARFSLLRTAIGSVFMGGGIAAMHYVGMAAMRMQSVVIYSSSIVLLSVILAIIISFVGLVVISKAQNRQVSIGRKVFSALLIGLAVPVMHYVGMASATFAPSSVPLDLSDCIAISTRGVEAIILISVTILALGIGCAYLDRSRQRISMLPALIKIGLLTAVSMIIFQYITDNYFSDLTMLQGNVLTAFFTTATGMIGCFLFMREREELHEKLLSSETRLRHRSDGDLENANHDLRREVDERRNTEEQLRMSERRFLAAARATHHSIWEWNIATNEIWTNAAGSQFGLARDPSTTLEWFLSIVHPDDVTRVKAGLDDAIQGKGDHWTDEYRVRRGNGSFAFVLDRAIIDRDAGGKALRMIGAMADVTQDKLLEQELRDAKEKAEAANRENKLRLEQTPLPMWIYDLESLTFIDVNVAALVHYGYTRHEVMNMTITDLLQPSDVAAFQSRVAKVSPEPGATSRSISRHKTKAGQLMEVEVYGRTIDWNGRAAEIVFVNDVTEQTRTTDYLNLAKAKAESANIAKSEFLANMSHEIRTPLNGIIGMTDLALETVMTPEQRDYLETVKISADSLLVVINDVLDFSKIEAGKFDLDDVTFDLRECMEETLKTLALRADEKGLELLCEIAADVPEFVIGDQNRLRQVVNNLVGNAIKFTHDGEVALRVQMTPPEDGRSMLHFTVSDTGIGIADEKQTTIFDPFTQADSSTTRKYGGTGLGLTISSRIVQLMHGRIWLESEVGRGTQFHFSAQMEAADSKPIQIGTIAPPEILSNVKVLVVDDNRTNRRILEGLLKRWDMKPTCVCGGPEALEELSLAATTGESFGLILTDMHMPDMDGFHFIERIREQNLSTAIIMMLTSAGHRGDAIRCEELGVAAYLLKPIRQSELREGIAKALGAGETHGRIPLITRFSLSDSRDPANILNILLAEDNIVNQRLATRLLEKRGHKVMLAKNGREALALLEKNSFDLIFMDLQMPEMDGMEATETIRKTEKNSGHHQHIIALTAHAMTGDRERCLAAGMDGYLSKPIRPLEIDEVLQSYIDQRRAAVASPTDVCATLAS